MKKSERMKPIKQLATEHEQVAVNELGQSQRSLSEHEMKLLQLRNYRAEYAKLFQEHGSRGMDGAQLQAYQTFLAQLDTAIRQQIDMIKHVEGECAEKRDVWQQRHTRTEALGKTVDRFQKTERKQQNRQEQRETDDRSNSRFWVLHNK